MNSSVRINLVVGNPNVDAPEECPDCLFDAVLRFPLYALSASGVTSWGCTKACARCYEEASA